MGLKITTLSDSTPSGTSQRLSLCMIVKDEEEALPRCLRSVQGVADEIVIVDTGSTDRTVEIAESFGAKVIHEPWTGDFARHRNTSIDAATGDWVLILDADEELVDGAALRPLLDDPDQEGYSLREVNFIGLEAGLEAVVNAAFRVFRNRPQYRYDGALHEQIQARVDPDGGSCTRFVGIEILHYGYLDHTTEARRKKDRNMRIVLEEVKRKPDDAFTLFNAGVEFQRIDDHRTALDYFSRAFKNLASMRQYFASLLVRNIVASLQRLERYDEALEVAADALEAYPDFTDLHYLVGQLHFARREYREAITSFRQAIDLGDHGGDRYMAQAGMGSFYSWFALGTLHEAIGDQSEAVRDYKLAVTSARGFYAPPLVRLAQLLLRNDEADRTEAFLRGILPTAKRADALRAMGEVFLSEGFPDRAQRLLQEALSMTPDTHAIRVTLAHCHLAAGAPDTALAVLDEVPASSESHAVACGKRVLIGLATGRRDVGEQGVADIGAIADGLYAYAWRLVLDAREGVLPEGELRADANQVTAVVFDIAAALMELGSLEAFNAMVPLLYRVATPEAALDERLGHLLLKHGFADPAADRLLASVREGSAGPETYAALGLLCDHKELREDAEVFFREALDRDRESIGRYLDLAGHLSGQGRYDEANDVLRAGQGVWPHSTILRELSQSLGVLAGSSAN
ncbi:MAG: glycosyltransferase [Thermoleophilia bacterium]|nr:glycosyltransferase [Thermoleophilia bacterium]